MDTCDENQILLSLGIGIIFGPLGAGPLFLVMFIVLSEIASFLLGGWNYPNAATCHAGSVLATILGWVIGRTMTAYNNPLENRAQIESKNPTFYISLNVFDLEQSLIATLDTAKLGLKVLEQKW